MISGIVITHVGLEASRPLGQDIGKQIFAQSKALLIAEGTVLFVMLIRGFSTMPFVILRGALFLSRKSRFKPTRAATPAISRAGAGLPSGAFPKASQAKQDDDGFSLPVTLRRDVPMVIEQSVE
jgi:type III secretory pathway component EscV